MKTNKYKKTTDALLQTSTSIGLGTFLLNLITISYWQRNGLDFLEISLMSIIAGIYLFILIIPLNIYFLNKTIRSYSNKDFILKRIYFVLLSLFISLLIFLTLDSIYYLFDSSFSTNFAKALKDLSESNGSNLEGLQEFSNLPFSLQNGIVTLFFGLTGTFISLIFIKKNGQLFNQKNGWKNTAGNRVDGSAHN